ncbi:MAG: substrate-binding domain-containing protein, partial [Caldilineaceae bacterium]|nr:substrate-binding domain-containing protein [Caldilineaceae bacterium]
QRDQVQLIAIPAAVNVVATYPIAPVADSAQLELARAFADFVVSPTGQAILEKYGFDHVQP